LGNGGDAGVHEVAEDEVVEAKQRGRVLEAESSERPDGADGDEILRRKDRRRWFSDGK